MCGRWAQGKLTSCGCWSCSSAFDTLCVLSTHAHLHLGFFCLHTRYNHWPLARFCALLMLEHRWSASAITPFPPTLNETLAGNGNSSSIISASTQPCNTRPHSHIYIVLGQHVTLQHTTTQSYIHSLRPARNPATHGHTVIYT